MNEKAKTVHEVAKLTGITARTLHYYDEIGLLKPSIITEAKYRQYTDDDLTRLQEILFFREALIVKVVVSKNLYSCFDRLSDIVLYLT